MINVPAAMRSQSKPLLLLLASLAGCASSTNGAAGAHSVGAAATVTPAASEASAVAVAVSPSEAPPPRAPGPLTRDEIDTLVRGGLGVLLGRVEVAPVLSSGRFVGFRLDAAQDLDAWHAAGADIRLGDVIVRVNGVRIERPEQAQWAFERLRIARAIEVDILRAGVPVQIRAPILDARAQSTRE